jgi:hypothetical protein
MRTTIEMAREAAGDDWGLFQEYMPEIHRLVELVRADEKARMAEQPAQQEPVYVQTRHKEDHGFSDWGSLLDPKHRNSKWAEGVEMRLLYTSPQPAQRTWVGLAEMEVDDIVSLNYPSYFDVAQAIEAKLKEKNT